MASQVESFEEILETDPFNGGPSAMMGGHRGSESPRVDLRPTNPVFWDKSLPTRSHGTLPPLTLAFRNIGPAWRSIGHKFRNIGHEHNHLCHGLIAVYAIRRVVIYDCIKTIQWAMHPAGAWPGFGRL